MVSVRTDLSSNPGNSGLTSSSPRPFSKYQGSKAGIHPRAAAAPCWTEPAVLSLCVTCKLIRLGGRPQYLMATLEAFLEPKIVEISLGNRRIQCSQETSWA